MSELIDRVLRHLTIENSREETSKENLQDYIRLAGDLLGRLFSEDYHSGFSEIDSERPSVEEGKKIKEALIKLADLNDDEINVAVIWALRKSNDNSFKDFYLKYLHSSLKTLLLHNSIVFQALLALSDIDEDAQKYDADDTPLGRITDIENNVFNARRFLKKCNIIVPW
jgi:hypothetical protein